MNLDRYDFKLYYMYMFCSKMCEKYQMSFQKDVCPECFSAFIKKNQINIRFQINLFCLFSKMTKENFNPGDNMIK